MRIGILTITPTVGFGGIMQAFALQKVVKELSKGEVEIINYCNSYTLKQRVVFFARNLRDTILKGRFTRLTPEGEVKFRASNTQSFIQRHIRMSKKVVVGKSFSKYVNERYDVVIVGSDQVWRPKYVLSIYDYFFEGINSSIKKIAYAASLGVSEWEFSPVETERCSYLLKNFDFISVRENSAIELVNSYLKPNVEVKWVLDPTLLLTKDVYKELFEERCSSEKYVFTYLLDINKQKENLVKLIGKDLEISVEAFSTCGENYSLPLKERVAPKVEDWLKGIYYSDFVVTDSFHGCVFSIIFNKPFLVYVNNERGSDRFESILGKLGLKDRMIYEFQQFSLDMLRNQIDWNEINIKLESERREIFCQLEKELNI